jgi:hypothetical protein
LWFEKNNKNIKMSALVEQQSAPGFKDPNQTLSGPIIGIIYPPPEVRSE